MGAQTLVDSVSISTYGDDMELASRTEPIPPYFVALLLIAFISLAFSFGNIERSQYLQVVVVIIRIFILSAIILTSFYIILTEGTVPASKIKLADFSYTDAVAGNTAFIFICHHSIPGIIYPVRPQHKIKKMFFWSYLFSAIALTIEGLFAMFAFGNVEQLYNMNFTNIPFVMQLVYFYPFLNVAAISVVTITLRNNILSLFGKNDRDLSNLQKGFWSILVTLPILLISVLIEDCHEIIKFTGGITGSIVMFVIPVLYLLGSKKHMVQNLLLQRNFHESSYSKSFWPYLIITFAAAVILMVIIGKV